MTPTPDANGRHHIVVGLDGSAGSTTALRWALNHADALGDIKPVMTWLLPWWAAGAGTPGAYVPPPTVELQLQAEDQLASQLEGFESSALLPPVVVHGRPGPTLVDISTHANLLVVGTRGRGALADTILGSVSTHVASHAKCPVAIIPEKASTDRTLSRIVVGIDGSDSSIHAIEWALDVADEETIIEVVHAWSAMPIGAVEASITIVDELRVQAERTADETVVKAAEKLDVNPRRFDIRVEMGDARNILRDASRGSDMLVVGARGHRGVAHLLLGSVATGLVHQPIVPTIVVPHEYED